VQNLTILLIVNRKEPGFGQEHWKLRKGSREGFSSGVIITEQYMDREKGNSPP